MEGELEFYREYKTFLDGLAVSAGKKTEVSKQKGASNKNTSVNASPTRGARHPVNKGDGSNTFMTQVN